MKWINVKDKLPERPEEYITAGNDGIVTTMEWNGREWLSDIYTAEMFDGRNPIDQSAITHWMPLPEPPNG